MCHRKTGVYFCSTHFRGLGLRTAGPANGNKPLQVTWRSIALGVTATLGPGPTVSTYISPKLSCVHGGVEAMYAMAHMWRSEDNFMKLGLFPPLCVLGIEFLCSETTCV